MYTWPSLAVANPPPRLQVENCHFYNMYWARCFGYSQWPTISKWWREKRYEQNSWSLGQLLCWWNWHYKDTSSRTGIDTCASALHALAFRCNSRELKGQFIRNKIVCDKQNNSVRRKLLQEPKLTLNRCLDTCRAAEAATAQVKAVTGQASTTSEEINLLRKSNRRSAQVKRSTKSLTARPEGVSDCRFCGKQHERPKNKCFEFGSYCKKLKLF